MKSSTSKKKQTRQTNPKYSKEIIAFRPTQEQLRIINAIAEKDEKKSQSTAVRALMQMVVNMIEENEEIYKAIFASKESRLHEQTDNEYNNDDYESMNYNTEIYNTSYYDEYQ